MLLRSVLFVFLFFIITALQAQLSGTITDVEGKPLSYATISYNGGENGTTSNLSGQYEIKLSPGRYTLVFQYIGYKSEKIDVSIDSVPLTLDMILQPEAITLSEVTIRANAEDPAYAIMRKTIAHRDKHKEAIQSYEGELYIKGFAKALDAPTSFLGQEVGDMEGRLDSNRQGVLYLSESWSTIFFRQPSEFKEVMHSSKTSGENSGFTFNQYSTFNFNFYQENIQFDRTMISPLHDNAFAHYRFKLEGVFFDDKGRLVNKIKVIPRDDVKPLFFGTIYIFEDQWNIHSLDLQFTGKAIKNAFFGFIRIRQLMLESEKEGIWYMQNQIIDFETGFFNFKFGGTFSYFFNNIKINQTIKDDVFGAELFVMEEEATEKSTTFWDSIRPIPLTEIEKADYIKRDSIQELLDSKSYLDSIDQRNNRFRWTDVIFGYGYNNTYQNRYINVGSPLGLLSFNAVEGLVSGSKVRIRDYDQEDNRRILINGQVQFGFSDRRWKGSVSGNYRFSLKDLSFFNFGIGREYNQFDERGAISNWTNTWASLLYKRNYIKLFDKRYLSLGYQSEISNGIYGWFSARYENRRPLNTTTNYSIFRRDRDYPSNHPLDNIEESVFAEHNALLFDMSIRWQPGQKYFNYEKFKARILSDWPTFHLFYRKAVALNDGDVAYDRLRFRVSDYNVGMKTYGYATFNLEGGSFLTDDRVALVDHFHFLGNQTTFTYYNLYNRGFKMMPFYRFSTSDDYAMMIYEHHFDGYLADQIPLIKDTNMTFVLGLGGLVKRGEDYYEWSFGIEKIGIGVLELFRVDFVSSYTDADHLGTSIKIGVSRFLDQVID